MGINMQAIRRVEDEGDREGAAMQQVFATILEFLDDNDNEPEEDLIEQIKPALAYIYTDGSIEPEDRVAWLLAFLAAHMRGRRVV